MSLLSDMSYSLPLRWVGLGFGLLVWAAASQACVPERTLPEGPTDAGGTLAGRAGGAGAGGVRPMAGSPGSGGLAGSASAGRAGGSSELGGTSGAGATSGGGTAGGSAGAPPIGGAAGGAPGGTAGGNPPGGNGGTAGAGMSGGSGAAGASGGSSGSGGASGGGSGSPGAAGAGGACPPATNASPCDEVPALATTPLLNGTVACGLMASELRPVGWTASGSPPVQVTWAAGHTGDALYVHVNVVAARVTSFDTPTRFHCGDAVEVFVDADGTFPMRPGYDDPGTVQIVIPAPAAGQAQRSDAWAWRNGTELGAFRGAVTATRTPTGYAVDVLVAARDVGLATWSLKKDAKVGLDVAIDVSVPEGSKPADPTCPRAGQFSAKVASSGACREPWCSVDAFCTPRLR